MDIPNSEQAVNLNTAGPDELIQLPGIGPKLAERIVEYRTDTPFEKVEDILNVPGISPARFVEWAERVTLAPPAREEPPTVEPAQAIVPWDVNLAHANRRGPARDLVGLLVTGLAGAILGAALALLAIAGLNRGTLILNQRDEVVALTARADDLADRAAALETEAGALRARLDALEALSGRVETVEGAVDELAAAAAANSAEIEALDERTTALSDDIELVRAAAERFNRFLDGLRDLLFQFQGAPEG
ncbi:MAG: ComEA family DNA-binding protein [Anaerolineales bacterium]